MKSINLLLCIVRQCRINVEANWVVQNHGILYYLQLKLLQILQGGQIFEIISIVFTIDWTSLQTPEDHAPLTKTKLVECPRFFLYD